MIIMTIILFIIVMYIIFKIPEWKACNRMPPPGKKTDWDGIIKDKNKGMSNTEVYVKMNKGGYDVPKK